MPARKRKTPSVKVKAKAKTKPTPPRMKIIARKCHGIENLGKLDRLRIDVFEADKARFEKSKKNGYGQWKDYLSAAMGYWIGYPEFLEMIGHDWHADNTRMTAYYALNLVHTQATHVLMEEAEKYGLDPHPLYECGRVMQEIFADAPEKYYASPYDTWPECMGSARYSLPTGQQEALRAGEAVFIRLAVKVGLADKEDMDEITRNVKPRHRPRTYDPVRDNKIKLAWTKSQAIADKPSHADFERDHHLSSGELERIINRCRKRQKRNGHTNG